MENTKVLVTGATGYIGQCLVDQLMQCGYNVFVVGRNIKRIEQILGNRVNAFAWDDFALGTLDNKNIKCVINLAGASIADKRWTKKRKAEILNSRIKATGKAVQYCLKNKSVLLNASAVGIYGFQDKMAEGLPPALDENTDVFSDEKTDFLSHVCRAWEKETELLKRSGVRVVNLRIGVVLGKGGGALAKMSLPFYVFAGGPIGSGKQAVAWISLEDACRAIAFLIKTDIDGPVNLTAPQCVNQKDLARALGKALRRPSFAPTPGIVLRIVLGQMAGELILNGQHVIPKVLMDYGFKFNHATISQALAEK